MQTPEFRFAFQDGHWFSDNDFGDFQVYCKSLGRLSFPTGRIVACDPLVFPETQPFTKKIRPGDYEVILSIARLGKEESKDERIVCAMVRFSRKVPRKWTMALRKGQYLKDLEPGNIFGYGVDSGTGCFMDQKAAKALGKQMEAQEDYFEEVSDAMHSSYAHTRSWANFAIADSGLNIAVFSSGMGDGFYDSYWGLDLHGEPTCLVTDFAILARSGG